ncbi:MAG: MBL fold metallo-hydrolase [bacterium]|nr:MBL fold metallo-hydrolase [bacterium]MDE0352913.1 MBL fold metallo-hydrolase [bacterium]
MDITTFRTDGLGDSTYLLTHDGGGVVIDPQRDVERFERAALDAGIQLTHVLETHIHNDYVSGGRDLARRTGARLVLPAAAGVAFDHLPAFHKEDLRGGPVVIRPLHTPGHTPEHMSYAILAEGEILAVFSGGSLLVGSAGRSDLLGDDRAEQLARLQYMSVHRLAELPDETGLYPTHGEGSFCTASGAGRTVSTIGMERRTNPVLAYPDVDAFVAGQLAGLQPFPAYYAHMGPINLMGPEPLAAPDLDVLDPSGLPDNAGLVDIRPGGAYAAGHIPGSLGLEMSDQVAVWAGWLLPFDSPVVLVAERGQDVEEAARQFGRIGFDNVLGVVHGVSGWVEAGGSLASFETRTTDELAAAITAGDDLQVLDVRSPGEWEECHLEGSLYRYLPHLKDGLPEGLDRSREVWVTCGSGYRAFAAGAFLEAAGLRVVVVTPGGVPDVLERLSRKTA